MKESFALEFAPFIGPNRLNVGCGASPESGWINMDFNPQAAEVIKHDLRLMPWPFARGSFDTVLASHVLEHFRDEELFRIMYEIAEVLRVGGHLIAAVPYALHAESFANPFHRSHWTEVTPPQFSSRLYKVEGTAGTGSHQFMPLADWRMVHVGLTPDSTFTGDDIDFARARYVNVIKEMQFVLRKES